MCTTCIFLSLNLLFQNLLSFNLSNSYSNEWNNAKMCIKLILSYHYLNSYSNLEFILVYVIKQGSNIYIPPGQPIMPA